VFCVARNIRLNWRIAFAKTCGLIVSTVSTRSGKINAFTGISTHARVYCPIDRFTHEKSNLWTHHGVKAANTSKSYKTEFVFFLLKFVYKNYFLLKDRSLSRGFHRMLTGHGLFYVIDFQMLSNIESVKRYSRDSSSRCLLRVLNIGVRPDYFSECLFVNFVGPSRFFCSTRAIRSESVV